MKNCSCKDGGSNIGMGLNVIEGVRACVRTGLGLIIDRACLGEKWNKRSNDI